MRVLVVEDERRLAEGLRAGLVADGFAVDLAHTGTDGLWLAREEPFDAMVLDLMLPGVNGYRICRTLRAEGIWTPILMLTAKNGEWDEVEGLVARLRALLRRGARERPAVLSAGDLRLDPAAHRACTTRWILIGTAATALTACSSGIPAPPAPSGPTAAGVTSAKPVPPGSAAPVAGPYVQSIDPAAFSATVDNPFFPLRPGMRWQYRSAT